MDVHALLTCCHAITSPQPQAVLSVVVTCVWSDSEPQHVWAVGNAQVSKRLELPQPSWQRSSELVVPELPATPPTRTQPTHIHTTVSSTEWMIPIYAPIATAIRLILLIKIIIIISAAVGTCEQHPALSLPSHEPLINVRALLTCCHAVTLAQPQAELRVAVTRVWSDSENQHVWGQATHR